MLKLVAASVIFALALSACSRSGAPGEEAAEPPLRTDRKFYVAWYERGYDAYSSYGFTLIATFENRTGETVYLSRCRPDSPRPIYGIELADGSDAQQYSAYDPIWACVGHKNQFAVAPGEARVDTFRVIGPSGWSENGIVGGAMEGRFRLLYEPQPSRGDGLSAHMGSAFVTRSNVFEVQVGY